MPVSIGALIADQLTAFKQHFRTVGMGYARSKNLTPYDVLIIASIIEKEAATRHDFPLVASVIYNRLRDHIPLGMDSTTRYEFNDYTQPLTQSQLSSPSPYNTRLHDGLPPTPISNPGMTAIDAAAHPARTNYLYFVVKPCGNGESVFESATRSSCRTRRATSRRGPSAGAARPPAAEPVTERTRLGVLGWPVAHSRSPQIQNAALAAVGLEHWRYQLLPIPPELFEETVRALPAAGFRGANVTIPHKQAALALADAPTDRARAIGAANTLTFEGGTIRPTTPTHPH